jgi:outer membrane protein OmpA-like peptidoglycan-associated protein
MNCKISKMKLQILTLYLFFAFTGFNNGQNALKSDENNALLHVTVTDMDDKLRKQEIILFEGKKSNKTYQGITASSGKFDILLPEGEIYLIKIKGLGEEEEYSTIEIESGEGTYEGSLTIAYEPARTFTFEDVKFDVNKATLRPESYKSLNDFYEILKIKSESKFEIAGHTDSDGDDESNLKLSQLRAESVVNYLISKGIKAERLIAKGYGETQPIENNDTEEGKQKNRRTEAVIQSE